MPGEEGWTVDESSGTRHLSVGWSSCPQVEHGWGLCLCFPLSFFFPFLRRGGIGIECDDDCWFCAAWEEGLSWSWGSSVQTEG